MELSTRQGFRACQNGDKIAVGRLINEVCGDALNFTKQLRSESGQKNVDVLTYRWPWEGNCGTEQADNDVRQLDSPKPESTFPSCPASTRNPKKIV